MQLKTLLDAAIIDLNDANIPTALLDARLLLQYAAKITQETVYLEPELIIPKDVIAVYNQYINRRINHEPVAKIIGKKSFWSSDFVVNKHVLDPRPDSEVIIETAINLFPNKNDALRVLDIGSGSGCLLLSILKEFPNATGIASDISEEALKVVKENIELLELGDRAKCIRQNWADDLMEKFDLIISNPPYIPTGDILALELDVKDYDPLLALDGGDDGLDPYRYLARQISSLLKPEAYAILEFGFDQGKSVRQIFMQQSYIINKMLFDLGGIERAIVVSI
ncbi:MAG: peptide chain release factor N(5)-glutamine methyltransferase [Rickettsiales bacterium]|jgi:release factor glutamine methyltransferase|nr:peptide chain release factor N(5)-glutamine methyltransferase [Rickettsiales bacterium]